MELLYEEREMIHLGFCYKQGKGTECTFIEFEKLQMMYSLSFHSKFIPEVGLDLLMGHIWPVDLVFDTPDSDI